MFETSVIHADVMAARSRTSLLTISLAAHSTAILGAILLSIATTEFPRMAPDQYANAPVLMPVSVPPPFGRPDGGGQPPRQQPQATPPPIRPAEITAPAAIPEEIEPAEVPGNGEPQATGEGTGTSAGPLGQPWGVEGGIGDLDAPPSGIGTPVEEKIYHVSGEVTAPVLLHKVEPRYPAAMSRNRIPATVVVRCVIDKNGRVRDPQVMVPAMPPFNASVLEAVRQWRYTPGSLHGQAVDVYLDLTVRFHVN